MPGKIEGPASSEPFIDPTDDEFLAPFIEFLMAEDKSGGEDKNTVRRRSQFEDFLRQIDEIKPGAGKTAVSIFLSQGECTRRFVGGRSSWIRAR